MRRWEEMEGEKWEKKEGGKMRRWEGEKRPGSLEAGSRTTPRLSIWNSERELKIFGKKLCRPRRFRVRFFLIRTAFFFDQIVFEKIIQVPGVSAFNGIPDFADQIFIQSGFSIDS